MNSDFLTPFAIFLIFPSSLFFSFYTLVLSINLFIIYNAQINIATTYHLPNFGFLRVKWIQVEIFCLLPHLVKIEYIFSSLANIQQQTSCVKINLQHCFTSLLHLCRKHLECSTYICFVCIREIKTDHIFRREPPVSCNNSIHVFWSYCGLIAITSIFRIANGRA